jgi:hypothetical protein
MKNSPSLRRILSLLATALPSAQSFAAPVQAGSCERFIDSIGICTHLQATSGSYGNFDGVIKPRLQELGIKHIRTDIMTNGETQPSLISKIKALGQIGIRSSLIFDSRLQGGTDSFTPAEAVQFLKDCGPANCVAEGPNEPNMNNPGWSFSYNGVGMPSGLVNYTKDLYNAIEGDPATSSVPVFLTSFIKPYNLGTNLDAWVDYGNIHPYPDGSQPGWQFNDYVTDGREETPTKPLVATETGWHTAIDRTDGFWAKGVPEDIQAKYTARLFFYFFNRGIHRTYLYELMEHGDPQGQVIANNHYGIIRQNNSAKPAFDAIKNLISILGGSQAFSPGTLDYSIAGDMTDVETTLLQSSNGKFFLVLYQNTYSYDIWADEYNHCSGADCYRSPANRSLTLTFNQSVSSVRTFQPVNGANATNVTVAGNQVSLSIPDHPLIVEVTPGGATSGIVNNGVYEIASLIGNNMRLDVSWGGSGNGTNVQIWTDNNGNAQRWRLTATDGGFYRVTPQCATGSCLDVSGVSSASGANVHIWQYFGGSNQQWGFQKQSDGTYEISPRHASDKRLDVYHSEIHDGTNVQIWEDNNTNAQRWRLLLQ